LLAATLGERPPRSRPPGVTRARSVTRPDHRRPVQRDKPGRPPVERPHKHAVHAYVVDAAPRV